MVQIKGIDVSPFQGSINWSQVKADNVEFAIIKATEGTSYIHTDYFNNNAPLALGAGVEVGAYHFGHLTSVAQAQAEADYFISVIRSHKLTYPAVLDIEVNDNELSKQDLTACALAFLQRVQDAGYFAMWYSYLEFVNTQLDLEQLKPFAGWIADYGINSCPLPVGMWQYSSTGKVQGITGNVDMDYSYVDYASLIAGMKQPAQAVAHPMQVVKVLTETDVRTDPDHNSGYICNVHPGQVFNVWQRTGDWHLIIVDPSRNITGWVDGANGTNLEWVDNPNLSSPVPVTYIVQHGDTLSSIGTRVGKSVYDLVNENHLADPNRIYVGQRLNV